jgi:uncharacterized membrane protein YfcA
MKLFSYVTGFFALLIVATAIISAATYAVTHNRETLHSLATGTLNGLGMAVGGVVGSFIVLRFKAARRFVRRIFDEAAE